MGVVTLNGRTPSPMAKLIMGRLPGGSFESGPRLDQPATFE
jgi:hypothetical protein